MAAYATYIGGYRMEKHTWKDVNLTVHGHEWYWKEIEKRINNGKQGWPHHHMPLLHQYYGWYNKEMSAFPTFELWFDAITYLGRAISAWSYSYRPSRPVFGSWKDRQWRVIEFLRKRDGIERERKRNWVYQDRIGGKWRKEWEPDQETWERKKEAREAKKAWRAYLNKDQRRWWRYCSGPGKFYKKYSSRKHRVWVKVQLRRENWEVFFPKERIELYNPWW